MTWLKCQSITSDNSSHVIFSLPNCDQTADPGTVRSHFDCKEPAAVFVGQSGQPFFVIGHRLFGKDLSVLVCHTDVVFLIPEVDADYRSVLFCFHRGRQDPRPLARPQLLLFPSSLQGFRPSRRCSEGATAPSSTSAQVPLMDCAQYTALYRKETTRPSVFVHIRNAGLLGRFEIG